MRAARLFPFLDTLRTYSVQDLKADLAAALTVTPMAVPQAMAYAIIAGVHPQYGIYACMLPVVLAALWGSSRYMAAGPTNAISMIIFSTLATVSVGGELIANMPEEARMGYVFGIALLCGLIQVGMGVSLALQKLNTALERKGTLHGGGRICTLGPIIHNPQVLAEYESRGVACVGEAAQLRPGDVAVIRAHGITRQVEEQLKRSGADIVDATCPKVKKAQLSIARATSGGATLLLFGEADHPEVRGLVSYACGAAHVFASTAELAALSLNSDKPYVLASQTTQDREIFQQIEAHLREHIHAGQPAAAGTARQRPGAG